MPTDVDGMIMRHQFLNAQTTESQVPRKGYKFYGFGWYDLYGGWNTVSRIEARSREEALKIAMKHGYPGHTGGWRNWLMDGLRRFMRRWTERKI